MAAGPEPLMLLMPPQKEPMCANLLPILASIYGVGRGLSQITKARFVLDESIVVARTCCDLSSTGRMWGPRNSVTLSCGICRQVLEKVLKSGELLPSGSCCLSSVRKCCLVGGTDQPSGFYQPCLCLQIQSSPFQVPWACVLYDA